MVSQNTKGVQGGKNLLDHESGRHWPGIRQDAGQKEFGNVPGRTAIHGIFAVFEHRINGSSQNLQLRPSVAIRVNSKALKSSSQLWGLL